MWIWEPYIAARGLTVLAVTALPRKTGPAQSILSLRCDGERRVMTHRRSSMGPTGPAQAFNIADGGRMEWAV